MENFTTASVLGNQSTIPYSNDTGVGAGNHEIPLPLFMRVPDWNRMAAKIFIGAMLALGVPGNILLILVLRRKDAKKKGSTDAYITCVAATDITSLLMNGTVEILRFSPMLWQRIGSNWLCKAHIYVQHAAFMLSTFLIFSIGVDRYLKVFRPHSTARLTKASTPVCIAGSVMAAISMVPVLFTMHNSHMGICQMNPAYKRIGGIFYTVIIGIALILSGVLAWIYIKIAFFLRKRERTKRTGSAGGASELGRSSQGRATPSGGCSEQSRSQDADAPGSTANPQSIGIISPGPTLARETGEYTTDAPAACTRGRHKGTQNVARTMNTMALISFVYVITSVLPPTALGVVVLTGVVSETMDMTLFFSTKLPLISNAANPILFAMTSSEFRQLASKMFRSLFSRQPSTFEDI